jgi:hypothetical protein
MNRAKGLFQMKWIVPSPIIVMLRYLARKLLGVDIPLVPPIPEGIRLHLGCGSVYLDGYVIIDYPLDQHSVLTNAVADVFADISELAFPGSSVDETRFHYVFEHFPRAESLALVASW